MKSGDVSLTGRLERIHELHFRLAAAATIDDLCAAAVEEGRNIIGVDRIGLWFLDGKDPQWFVGSFGIDETGSLRDERHQRIPRDPAIYDSHFFERKIPYRLWKDSPVYNDRFQSIGRGELIVLPLWNGRESLGALAADNLLSGTGISEEECQLLVLLGRMVGLLVTIKRTEKKLESLATIDSLTGLLNRRAGLRFLEQQMSIAKREQRPLTICFLDLDGLKGVNDEMGHAQGDVYLRETAEVIQRCKRGSDMACRMGGDEFMLIFPECPKAAAGLIIERIARECPENSSFSYGLAQYAPETDSLNRLIKRADEGMYHSKRQKQAERCR